MKSLLGFTCVVLIVICAVLTSFVLETERHAARWSERTESVEVAERYNNKLLESARYSEKLMESVQVLASENMMLCERDAKMAQVVSQYKEENRRLKQSLTEAVNRLRKQNTEMNELHEHIDRLMYKIQVLEKALNDTACEENKVYHTVDVITTVVSILPAIL